MLWTSTVQSPLHLEHESFSLLWKNSAPYSFFSCTYMTFPAHFRILPVLYSFYGQSAKYIRFRHFYAHTGENLNFLLFCLSKMASLVYFEMNTRNFENRSGENLGPLKNFQKNFRPLNFLGKIFQTP